MSDKDELWAIVARYRGRRRIQGPELTQLVNDLEEIARRMDCSLGPPVIFSHNTGGGGAIQWRGDTA